MTESLYTFIGWAVVALGSAPFLVRPLGSSYRQNQMLCKLTMRAFLSVLLLVLSSASVLGQQDQEASAIPQTKGENDAWASIPPLLAKRFAASGLNATYSIGFDTNPFYLQGDFDGDGRPDYVVRLKSKKVDAEIQDVVFLASGMARWISKDTGRDYPGPAWYVVFKRETVFKSPFEKENEKLPKLLGDGIMMVKPESSSALVFWNGTRFQIYWQGD